MFLKIRNISSKIKRSKVTDYAALKGVLELIMPSYPICDAFCDFGACGGTTSSAENATLNDVNNFLWRRTLFVKRTPA